MLNNLNLNIFNFYVQISSTEKTVIQALEKDFAYFKKEMIDESELNLHINIIKDRPPLEKIPNIKPTFNRKKTLTFDYNQIRYNNYENKLLSILDFKSSKAELYSIDNNLLHEISYLLILSRSGKWLDIQNLHKIHACGFQYNEMNTIVAMPMGEGKSTLFCELIKHREVKILSDDTPLISGLGEILPFPLRVGLCDEGERLKEHIDKSVIYSMIRREYGKKYLLPIDAFDNEIASKAKNQVLLIGKRVGKDYFKIKKKSYLSIMLSLFYHMIIGIGLPLIFEYFWEKGVKDFKIKTIIFFKRLRSAHNLARSSNCYSFIFGNDPHKNAEKLLKFLKEHHKY
jgi:hypothetical protein